MEMPIYTGITYAVTEREVARMVSVTKDFEIFNKGLYLQFKDKMTAQHFINRDSELKRYIKDLKGLFPLAYAESNKIDDIRATKGTKTFMDNKGKRKLRNLFPSITTRKDKARGKKL
ncbi:MAG: hypothetical protein J0I41_17225 [Filimonas sp.]|nr:hypothetical protein [Filimonas sp.]